MPETRKESTATFCKSAGEVETASFVLIENLERFFLKNAIKSIYYVIKWILIKDYTNIFNMIILIFLLRVWILVWLVYHMCKSISLIIPLSILKVHLTVKSVVCYNVLITMVSRWRMIELNAFLLWRWHSNVWYLTTKESRIV